MWILFALVILADGEPIYLAAGKEGAPHKFKTQAQCEARAIAMLEALLTELPPDAMISVKCTRDPDSRV